MCIVSIVGYCLPRNPIEMLSDWNLVIYGKKTEKQFKIEFVNNVHLNI